MNLEKYFGDSSHCTVVTAGVMGLSLIHSKMLKHVLIISGTSDIDIDCYSGQKAMSVNPSHRRMPMYESCELLQKCTL